MHKSILFPVAIVAAVTATPAVADLPYAVTPSGRTEAIFDMSVVDTSDKIANGCADVGWTLVSTTQTMVVCEAQLTTMQSVLAALAMGNRYSTPPKQYLRFNIAGLDGGSRVQATGWVETQMAFGQVRTEEMSSANYHNAVMDFLINLGGRFPPGTSFPNHALLGVSGGTAVTSPTEGIRVEGVDPGSPADKGGIQVGDIITKIAKERVKNGDDLLDGLRKAVKDPSYEVEFLRAGKASKTTLERAYRTAVVAPALREVPPVSEQATMATVVTPLSPADELAKFAKLHEQGVITDAEFAAAKARLLGEK